MNKNNKGQVVVGTLILFFIGAIVALTLIVPSAQNTGLVTNTEQVTNASLVIPAALNTPVALRGQSATSFTATNGSGTVINTSSYTVTNYVIDSTGTLSSNVKFILPGYNATTIKVNYVNEPLTYSTDAGTRTVTNLIVVFAALAIVAFAIYYAWENGGSELFGY